MIFFSARSTACRVLHVASLVSWQSHDLYDLRNCCVLGCVPFVRCRCPGPGSKAWQRVRAVRLVVCRSRYTRSRSGESCTRGWIHSVHEIRGWRGIAALALLSCNILTESDCDCSVDNLQLDLLAFLDLLSIRTQTIETNALIAASYYMNVYMYWW